MEEVVAKLEEISNQDLLDMWESLDYSEAYLLYGGGMTMFDFCELLYSEVSSRGLPV